MQSYLVIPGGRPPAWTRPYRRKPRPAWRRVRLTARQSVTATLLALLLALLTGCGLEAPEAPQFETTLNIPAVDETYDTAQLIESSDYLEGGATGGTTDLVIRGTFGPTTVGAALDVTLAAETWEAPLNSIAVAQPPELTARFNLEQILGMTVAEGGETVVVPEVTISPTRNTLAVFDAFDSARLAGGTLVITLVNRFPVPLGSSDGSVAGLVLRLRDAVTGEILLTCLSHSRIEAGATVVLTSDLAGLVLTNRLEAEVEGRSPGSDAKPVAVSPGDALDIRFALDGLRYDWVELEPPAQEVTFSAEMRLDETLALDAAELRGGRLNGSLRNTLPLPIAVTLTSPELRRNGPFVESWLVPAGTPGNPGIATVSIDMSGVDFQSLAAEGRRALRLELTGSTAASAMSHRLDSAMGVEFRLDETTLELDEVSGTFDARPVTLTPVVSPLDLPEGIDPIRFERATLTIDVENGTGVTALADLVLRGKRSGKADVVLPLAGHTIEPGSALGPTATRITLTETNSALLDFLHGYPEQVRLEGQVTLGDGVTPGIVRRSDAVTGSYRLAAPLRLRFAAVEHVAESFSFDLDADAQKQIREHVTAADLKVRVTNRFPVGVTLALGFGADSLSAADSAEVMLAPVTIEGAPVGADGRASGSNVQEVVLTIPAARIGFFARDVVWGSARLTVHGAGPDRAIEIQETDSIHLKALARFRYEVK